MPDRTEHQPLDAEGFRVLAHGGDDDAEATEWVLDHLGDRFTVDQLDARLSQLEAQRDTRRNVVETTRRLRRLVARIYSTAFSPTTELAERVLCPSTSAEANGLEDARFVRFVDDDDQATVTYYATYTAFDGSQVAQQLLSTTDFRDVLVVAAGRSRRGQQGDGAVPPPHPRALRRR